MAGINIPFLSNVRDFLRGKSDVESGLDDVADSLDDLARESDDTTRKLDRGLDDVSRALDDVSRDADDAGDKIEDALTDAAKESSDAAADLERKYKDALDAAGNAAKGAGDEIGTGVRAGTDKAGEGLDEFKDEANSTARESAASFTGSFDDVADVLQEVAANAFAGFGPAGAAAGIAAAAGIGMLISSLQESADEVNENKDRIVELAAEISEAGGRLDEIDFAGKMREWGLEIVDARSWFEPWQADAITRFEDIERKARAAGVSVRDTFRGMSGSDPEAAARVIEEIDGRLERLNDELRAGMEANQGYYGAQKAVSDEYARAAGPLQALRDELAENAGLTEEAIDLQRRLDEALSDTAGATAELQQAQTNMGESLAEFVDPLDAYTELLAEKEEAERTAAQATADATADQTDSWEDYADDVSVAVDDYLGELERQVQAQEEWAGNLATLAERGVSEGVLSELAKMGPEGAPLVAALTTASDKELARMEQLYGRRSAAAIDAMTDELGRAATEGRRAINEANDTLPGVKLRVDSSGLQRDVDRAAARIRPPVIVTRIRMGQAAV